MGLAQAGTHYQKLKLEIFITETVKTIDLVLAIISLIKEKAAIAMNLLRLKIHL